MKTENECRTFWDKTWSKFLKHQGMIAPSGKLVQLMIPYLERKGFVLDIGCGEGRNTIYLTRIGYRTVGLDLSTKGIKVLSNNLFEEELKASPLVGDARQLPFSAGAFSGVLAHNLFDHLDKAGFTMTMEEVFRVLAPNGVLLMTLDPLPDNIPENQTVLKDDGSRVFISGPRKGLLLRPFNKDDLKDIQAHGWEILKDELSPRKSKILLLRKKPQSS